MTTAAHRKAVFARLGVEPEPKLRPALDYLPAAIVALFLFLLLALFGGILLHYGAAESLPMIGVLIAVLIGLVVIVARGDQ